MTEAEFDKLPPHKQTALLAEYLDTKDPELRAMLYKLRPDWRLRKRRIDWDKEPLGKVPDTQIAQKLGIPYSKVAMARLRRKIPVYVERHIDWEKVLLAERTSRLTDKALARKLGVSHDTVRRARAKHKIHARNRIDWSKIPLGKMSDSEISKRYKIKYNTVAKARRRYQKESM